MADAEPVTAPEPSRPEQQEAEPVLKEADQSNDTEPTDAPEKALPESTDNAEEQQPAESAANAEADEAADKDDGGDGGKATGTTDQAATETATNGTPSTTKKAANGKRKSFGTPGPKKLSKKKSMVRIYHLDVQPGETYLARMKSHAPWPSIVCDEEMLPQSLLSTRPMTTKKPDGTYAEAYEDGGKKVNDRTFPVMFMHTNEFAWIPNMDLTPLKAEDCKDVPEKGKSKALLAAYQVAAEGHDLEYFKTMLADHERALQEDLDEKEAKAAAKAAREEKKKRKSMEVVDDAEDEDVEESGMKKSTKKRKKDLESEGEQEKPVKTPKPVTKLKLTTPKAPGTAEESGKKAAGSAKAPKRKSKKAAKADVSDEQVENPKEAEKPVNPQEAEVKRKKEILYLRHKLQKGFLTRDQAPEEAEMDTMSTYINRLEMHTDLEVSIIRSTKIHKVLKAIIKLPTIPKEEEHNFRGRAVKILSKWKQLLESDIPSAGEATASEKPTSNGIHKKGKAGDKKANKPDEKKDKGKTKQEERTEEAEETTAEPSKDGDISMVDADDVKPEAGDEKPEAEAEKKPEVEDEKKPEAEDEKPEVENENPEVEAEVGAEKDINAEEEKQDEEAGTPAKDVDAMEI